LLISTLQTIASFVFVLGVLIFVHELGHFLVARLYGVRVIRFSLGFDPKLIRFERGGTEYSIGLIPLGGFVKLAGETVEDQRTGAPDEFLSKSKWVRLQVYLAGPIMNMILAVLLVTVVISRGADIPLFQESVPVIGSVTAGSAADKAGLKPGDRILRVDDRDVATWDEMDQAVMPKAKRETELIVLRRGERVTLRVTPDSMSRYEIGNLGVSPVVRPQITVVNEGGPAARAGLQRGDVITAVNGQHLEQPQIVDLIHASAGTPLTVTINRGGAARDVTVVPEAIGGQGLMGVQISAYEVRRVEPNLARAFVMSAERNWSNAVMIGETLSGLFRGQTPVRQLMGPVAIAQLSGSAAKLGWLSLFELMAMISLNLGLINLLPIPVMDGGQIAILAFEGLIRRELSLKIKERILLAGAALIVLLMVTVIYNDIMRLVK
jgi:regulator of sigma E protease